MKEEKYIYLMDELLYL